MSNEEILEQNEELTDEQAEQAATSEVASEDEQVSSEEAPSVEQLVERLQTQLAESEQKAAENWDQVLRVKAEMENIRRRTQKDLENAHKFALEKFVNELLSVKDSLEMGISAANEASTVDSLLEGADMTLNMLKQVFEKFNVVEVDPQGEKFNPEHHQAMSMQESADVEANTVIAVMQKGYLLNERLVRPAMVMVSKAAAKDD